MSGLNQAGYEITTKNDKRAGQGAENDDVAQGESLSFISAGLQQKLPKELEEPRNRFVHFRAQVHDKGSPDKMTVDDFPLYTLDKRRNFGASFGNCRGARTGKSVCRVCSMAPTSLYLPLIGPSPGSAT